MLTIGDVDATDGHGVQIGDQDRSRSVGQRKLQGQFAGQPAGAFPRKQVEACRVMRPRHPSRSDRGVDRLNGAADVFLKRAGQIARCLFGRIEVGMEFLEQVNADPQPQQQHDRRGYQGDAGTHSGPGRFQAHRPFTARWGTWPLSRPGWRSHRWDWRAGFRPWRPGTPRPGPLYRTASPGRCGSQRR